MQKNRARRVKGGKRPRRRKHAVMRIGYARVSTEDQKLDLQTQVLNKSGCDIIFTDHGFSGGSFERPGLAQALSRLKEGDTLVVWRLDRLGRSLVKLVQVMDEFRQRGVHFHSLTENIDTSSSGGKLMFHMIAALSEFERTLISERTRAGMAAARNNGQRLGRPPSLTDEELDAIVRAINERGESLRDAAIRNNVSLRSLRRMMAKARDFGTASLQANCGPDLCPM
ncbi:recombinase family protein [Rhizobium quercicola]